MTLHSKNIINVISLFREYYSLKKGSLRPLIRQQISHCPSRRNLWARNGRQFQKSVRLSMEVKEVEERDLTDIQVTSRN